MIDTKASPVLSDEEIDAITREQRDTFDGPAPLYGLSRKIARAVIAAYEAKRLTSDEARDAARYRWLRDRLFGADFAWRAALATQPPAPADRVALSEQDLMQILHDPENQPSQFGTVPYAQTERAAQAEIEELHALNDRLSDLLTRSVNALRGDPLPLMRWSWHDLPERIAAAMAALQGACELASAPADHELALKQARNEGFDEGYSRAIAMRGDAPPAAQPATDALAEELEDWMLHLVNQRHPKPNRPLVAALHLAINALCAPPPAAQAVPQVVLVLELIRALEGKAANTDTDWRWLAAQALRRNDHWETASIWLTASPDVSTPEERK